MYASGSSNCFSEIGHFNELKYDSSAKNPRKKRCVLTAITALPKEHTHTSGAYEQLRKCTTLIAEPPTVVLDPLCTAIATSKPFSLCSKPKKENWLDPLVDVVLPTEEVLGSVTTFYPTGHSENGHALRTSARVKHKMRMETIHSAPLPPERKEQPKPSNAILAKTPTQQKQIRVVWSNHDKNLFFEALNEYGKDFEAILNYLNTKKRRKDNACEQQVFKTKDVRNLYYQFNQKISKYLHFCDEVKKEAQELYALINYGEMRKKVPFQNKKYFHKLKDLVYKGVTVIREKGKTIRIKTPSCRALRKLNQLEEWQEEIKLPPRVDVLLQPANMEAWGRVQSLAQNPRIRITVTIQKRVSALLQMFQQKWRPQEIRLVERVEKMKLMAATVTSKLMRQRMQNEINFGLQLTQPAAQTALSATSSESVSPGVSHFQLHFAPPQSATIHRPLISLAEFQSNTSICLNSYEQRIGVKVRGETLATLEKPGSSTCKDGKKSKLYPDAGQDGMKDEKHVTDMLTKSINNKSQYASNESIEMKDIEMFEVDLSNGLNGLNGARSGDDCDGLETLIEGVFGASGANVPSADHAYATTEANACTVMAECDLAANRQSDNSNDGFALLHESVPMKCERYTTAEFSGGEEAAVKGSSKVTITNTITTCDTIVTTSTTTTVRKRDKCSRRKAGDASKMASSAGLFNPIRPLVSEQDMQRIRDGWTLSNVNDLTVGDLYIIFGEDMKLHLDYDWVWEDPALVRPVPSAEVKLLPVPSSEQPSPPITPKAEEGEQQHQADSSPPNPTPIAHDDACLGNDNSSAAKEEPSMAGMANRDESKNISRRLQQLLMLVKLGGTMGKKKCACGNTSERKPKRSDGDPSTSTGQDDGLLFKQPMLPSRNSANYLVPEPMHMPPQVRYKQSRWWRTRINRNQVNQPLLHLFRLPNSAADASIASDLNDRRGMITDAAHAAASRAPIPHSKATDGTTEAGSNSLSTAATSPLPGETNAATLHYDEENANDTGASPRFMLAGESIDYTSNQTNPTSSIVPTVKRDAQQPPGENTVPVSDLATAATEGAGAAVAVLPQNDDSCLSLFDLSLPSTSSSLMANIFTSANGDGSESSDFPQSSMPDLSSEPPVDAKLLHAALNDISLTSFFGQLDAVYQEVDQPGQQQPVQQQSVHHPPVHHQPVCPQPLPPTKNIDLDLSAMSESSVDYIERFESIASELRSERNA